MAIRAHHLAFPNLIEEALDRTTRTDEIRDIGGFGARVSVVELQHYGIALLTPYARMQEQILAHNAGVARPLERIVSPIALDIRSLVAMVVFLGTASAALLALAMALARPTVLQREVLSLPRDPAATADPPLPHAPL